MKFEEFKNLIEERRRFLLQGEKTKADEIENIIDPNNLGIKRYFKVKKRRVERVITEYFANRGIFIKFDIKMRDKSFDWIIKLPYGEHYLIKCSKKKDLGYVDLKCLYSEFSAKDDMQLLIDNYPEIIDGLWDVVLKTNNEEKRKKIFSINAQILKNNQEAEYLNKEQKMVLQLNEKFKERKQQMIESLDEIDIEGNEEINTLQ